MKRFIRSEKSRLIEKAKTVIIVLLFFVCVFLGYRILRLYNAQTNVEGALWGSAGGSAEVMESGNNAQLNMVHDRPWPDVIMANTYLARNRIDADSLMFKTFAKLADKLMGEAYHAKNEDVSAVSMDEWESALKFDSVYFRYPLVRYAATDASFYGAKSADALALQDGYSELIIAYDKYQDYVLLYFARQDRRDFLKVNITGDTAEEFREKATKLDLDSKKDWIFAWELNLDTKTQNDKVLFDPMLLMCAEEEKTPDIRIDVPKYYVTELDFTKATDLTLSLVNIFNYNPNTIRQYVGKDNAIMFVGETGSLSLHPDGIIEYKALDTEDGVPISKDGSCSDVMYGLCAKLEKIMRTCGINTAGADFKAKLTQMPSSYNYNDRLVVTFDYFVKNSRIEIPETSAIRAVIVGGKLVELKMYLIDTEVQGKQSALPDIMDSINEYCIANPQCNTVNKAYSVYKYNKDNENISADWKIEGA